MRRSILSVSIVLVALALLASACGRNDLERECTSNADCAGDRVCVGGACYAPDNVPDTGDGDVGVDTTDTDSGTVCTSDSDCPGSGSCESRPDDGCGAYVCVIPDGQNSGTCEFQSCDIGCAPWESQMGCECIAQGCESQQECGNFACIDGSCAPCEADAQCPSRMVCDTNSGECVDGQACESDSDCPADKECDDGTCVDRPECLLDGDCGEQEICLNGRCTYSPECETTDDCDDGFECVGGRCYETRCRGPEDCADGEICEAGECIEPDPDEVDSCFVAGRSMVISENQRVRLEAFAVDADGNGVPANFVWTSSDTSVATIDSNQYAVGAGGTGTTTVTAETAGGGISCSGEYVLEGQADVPADEIRVVVVDGATGSAVSNAEVVLENGNTATTNSAGVAMLPDPQSAYTVTVYAGAYNWVTVQNIQAEDIRIPLTEKQGSGPVAGFTGQFDESQLNTTGDITLGLAGASLPGSLLDMDLQKLLGDPFVTEIEVPGFGSQTFPLPGGLVAHGQVFGLDLNVKETYYVNTSGGARLGWGLAGKVPAQRLINLFQGGGGQGDVLTTLLPLFNRFDHAVRPLNLQEQPRVTDSNDIDGDGNTSEQVPDYNGFPNVTLTPTVQQNLVSDVDVSNFPVMTDGDASVAVIVGGTYLDSPGLVPLGISATSDEDGDGTPDSRRLSLAPPHSSATGGRYTVMAIAFRPDDVGISGGVQFPDEFSVAMWNGQSLSPSIGLGTFPDAANGSVDDSNRQISFDADAGPLYRVRLVGSERTWDVWSLGSAGSGGVFTHTMTLPTPHAGRTDLFQNGEILLDTVSTNVTLDDLVRATGVGLREAGLVSTSYSRTKLR